MFVYRLLGSLAVATALVSAPAQAGPFGKVLKKVLQNAPAIPGAPAQGTYTPGTTEGPANWVAPKKPWEVNQSSEPLAKLPAEFSKPFPKAEESDLTAANISRLIERDMGGIKKVLKLAAERESGPMWTERTRGDGSLESMWASLLIHAYVQHHDGTCSVYLTGFAVEKPWIPETERFGAIQVDNQDGNKSYVNQRCDLK